MSQYMSEDEMAAFAERHDLDPSDLNKAKTPDHESVSVRSDSENEKPVVEPQKKVQPDTEDGKVAEASDVKGSGSEDEDDDQEQKGGRVPLARFQKVYQERKKFKTELEALQAEVERLKSQPQQPLPSQPTGVQDKKTSDEGGSGWLDSILNGNDAERQEGNPLQQKVEQLEAYMQQQRQQVANQTFNSNLQKVVDSYKDIPGIEEVLISAAQSNTDLAMDLAYGDGSKAEEVVLGLYQYLLSAGAPIGQEDGTTGAAPRPSRSKKGSQGQSYDPVSATKKVGSVKDLTKLLRERADKGLPLV